MLINWLEYLFYHGTELVKAISTKNKLQWFSCIMLLTSAFWTYLYIFLIRYHNNSPAKLEQSIPQFVVIAFGVVIIGIIYILVGTPKKRQKIRIKYSNESVNKKNIGMYIYIAFVTGSFVSLIVEFYTIYEQVQLQFQ